MKCRHCHSELSLSLVNLGTSPPSNSYLTKEALHSPEIWYPLNVLICENCWLVQTEDFNKANELFNEEYAYFSSFSDSWLAHAREFAEAAVSRFNLDEKKLVVEVASNDGYLLQYFKKLKIPSLGIEPTKSTAKSAEAKGLEVVQDFFGTDLAKKLTENGRQADLMIANNVLAHVPDINDFVAGFSQLLKPNGVASFEFPHLLTLIENCLFDTIYHEHYSYLSLQTVSQIFEKNNLIVFDVEELKTHGGSLRVFVQKRDSAKYKVESSVSRVLKKERDASLFNSETFYYFQETAQRRKNDFVEFLLATKKAGKSVAAYGAAAKGNTFLNYSGIRADLLPWVVDRNPEKQNKYMPGSRIPIVNEDFLRDQKPNYVIILPWNLTNELIPQLSYIREWGGQFVVAQPNLEIIR